MAEKCIGCYENGECEIVGQDCNEEIECGKPGWACDTNICPSNCSNAASVNAKHTKNNCTGKCVTVIVDPNNPDDTCSCKHLGNNEGGACGEPDKCQMFCERWATKLDCNNSNNGGRNNSNNGGRNNSNNGNVKTQSTTDGSGISAGAGIAIGIVSIFALVGFIALIIGGGGNQRRRTRGNRRSR